MLRKRNKVGIRGRCGEGSVFEKRWGMEQVIGMSGIQRVGGERMEITKGVESLKLSRDLRRTDVPGSL